MQKPDEKNFEIEKVELFEELNSLLVETFNIILKEEENALRRAHGAGLSMSEYHLIDSIVKLDGGAQNISRLAVALGISPPSVTVAIKKLESKGYVKKSKSLADGRITDIVLTEKGEKIKDQHESFHRHMVAQMIAQLCEDEKTVLAKAMSKLNEYFKHTLMLEKMGCQTAPNAYANPHTSNAISNATSTANPHASTAKNPHTSSATSTALWQTKGE